MYGPIQEKGYWRHRLNSAMSYSCYKDRNIVVKMKLENYDGLVTS